MAIKSRRVFAPWLAEWDFWKMFFISREISFEPKARGAAAGAVARAICAHRCTAWAMGNFEGDQNVKQISAQGASGKRKKKAAGGAGCSRWREGGGLSQRRQDTEGAE